MKLGKKELLQLYRNLVRSRKADELSETYSGKFTSVHHTGFGQEAIGVGACTFLEKDDMVAHTHRGWAHLICKGLDPKIMFAEAFGKATGCCGGFGGTWHQAKPSIGLYGLGGTVGSQFNFSAGLALSAQMKKTNQVVICFFGDGAANRGTLHEGMNLSAIWKLPVIFVCENNKLAVLSRVEKVIAVSDIATYAGSYGFPGVVVDGNDVIAVHEAVSEAVKRARQGLGPSLIECKTFRIPGHCIGWPQYDPYHCEDEVKEWLKKDPIERFKNELIKQGILNEEQIALIEKEAEQEMQEAVKFADESPYPDPDKVLLQAVYAD